MPAIKTPKTFPGINSLPKPIKALTEMLFPADEISVPATAGLKIVARKPIQGALFALGGKPEYKGLGAINKLPSTKMWLDRINFDRTFYPLQKYLPLESWALKQLIKNKANMAEPMTDQFRRHLDVMFPEKF